MQKIIVNKSRENPYVQVLKNFLGDDRISWKAKGLFSYLLSKPENWVVRENDLIKQSTDGRDSIRAGVEELIKYGYVVKVERREKGKFVGMEWILHESPQAVEIADVPPQTEKPSTVKPLMEKPLHSNNDYSKTDNNNKEQQQESVDIAVVSFEFKDLPKGITVKLLDKLRATHDTEVIQRQLKNLRKALATQKIKNTAGWLTTACNEDYESTIEPNLFAPKINYVVADEPPVEPMPLSEDFKARLLTLPNLSQFAGGSI